MNLKPTLKERASTAFWGIYEWLHESRPLGRDENGEEMWATTRLESLGMIGGPLLALIALVALIKWMVGQ